MSSSSCNARYYIYIITNEYLRTKNLFKLGYTENFSNYLKQFNLYQPINELKYYKFKLYEKVKCTYILNKTLRRHFKHKQCRETGKNEWFYLSDNDLVYIDTIATAWINETKCICRHQVKINKQLDTMCSDQLEYYNQQIINVQIKDIDSSVWIEESNYKYSLNEICTKLNLDIKNNRQTKIFWKLTLTHKITIDDEMLDYLGYNGSYRMKCRKFHKVLQKNPHIPYKIVSNKALKNSKQYCTMRDYDFEDILVLIRTKKAIQLRKVYSIMKAIILKYCEYENLYNLHMKAEIEKILNN